MNTHQDSTAIVSYPLAFIPVFWVRLALVGGMIFVFALTYFARVSYAGGDSRYSLLVSQTLWQNGTIQLDDYADLDDSKRQLKEHNGHLYYYFPIGTPLFSTPFVWLANQFGRDMRNGSHDAEVQNLLSALSCVMIYLLLYQISRNYLSPAWSLILATTTMLGSSFVSTLGTALWNLNFSTLFVLLAIWLWHKCQQPEASYITSILLGFSLFAAFICRPTTAPFIALLLIYFFVYQRTQFWAVASTAALLLGGWLAFNVYEFGQLLAPYYGVSRLQTSGEDSTITAIYGQLFSPSRGIFVFSPFLFLSVGVIVWHWRTFWQNKIAVFCASWFLLHVIVVSLGDSVPWWGGHSYGPRFLTDVLPALFLLSLFVLQAAVNGRFSLQLGRFFILGYLMLGAFAIFVNGLQGLYNGNTARWNGTLLEPDPGIHRQYLFDWRYPQFLAFKQNLCERHQEFIDSEYDRPSQPLPLNEGVFAGRSTHEVLFTGFSNEPLANGRYYSECENLTATFQLDQVNFESATLTFYLIAQTPQKIDLWINDIPLPPIVIEQPVTDVSRFTVMVPADVFTPSGENRLILYQPAVDSLIGDPHTQGIVLDSFALETIEP